VTEDVLIRLAVLVIQAFPPIASAILSIVRPDVAQTIREQLAGARATMAAAPSPTPDVVAMVARAKALAARHPRISAHHADVLARLVRPTSAALLTREERDAIGDLVPVVRELAAVADTEILSAPSGAWSEPHEGD